MSKDTPREDTGAKDIHGAPIYDGDEVWLYAQDYSKTREQLDGYADGEAPVYLIDQSKPLPIADVPLARGIVCWDGELLAYTIRYTWKCQQWNDGAASCHMGGCSYAYELATSNTVNP